jgi:hypothetical protein
MLIGCKYIDEIDDKYLINGGNFILQNKYYSS